MAISVNSGRDREPNTCRASAASSWDDSILFGSSCFVTDSMVLMQSELSGIGLRYRPVLVCVVEPPVLEAEMVCEMNLADLQL